MKHRHLKIALMLALALTSASAASVFAQDGEFDGTIRIGGSTTLLPVIADCASQFMDKFETWDKVDAGLPNKRVLIFVTGGGSGFGVNASINGTVDIGMASRNLKDQEKEKLGDYEEFLVSKDCLAFAVNKANPLAKLGNLTRQDVARIYSGEAKTFKDVRSDLPAKPILVQMRDMAGGSTEMVQSIILKDKTFTPSAVQVPSQGANLKKLEGNASAIAYLSSVIALESDKLKVFKYEGVAPSNENAVKGTYPITRPLLLIVKGEPTTAERIFIEFVLSEGQAIVVEHGYVPVKSIQ
jgi:phosphate transport system substrate-binding protein